MLGEQIMLIASICMLFIMTMFGLGMQGVPLFMGTIQAEAQAVARSEGVYGGYNTVAEASIQEFAQEHNIDPSQITVSVSAPGAPVPYGTEVTATLTVPYTFGMGSFMPDSTVYLTETGKSVSLYTPDLTPPVEYVSP